MSLRLMYSAMRGSEATARSSFWLFINSLTELLSPTKIDVFSARCCWLTRSSSVARQIRAKLSVTPSRRTPLKGSRELRRTVISFAVFSSWSAYVSRGRAVRADAQRATARTKQLDAEDLLEFADALRDGGLGQPQIAGGSIDAAQANRPFERPDLRQGDVVHGGRTI